ncbi:uncharacterized protein LOC108932158 isoform X2 [Scleropages formosus]|uniref:uncharacterized protein LOC108932158 isoform X2 n=1 Tax=Scleropages formosus TaxID=113540 RepID=UPI00087891D3|nr:uncharacterized protein LOC108932158 isoform X2 [Scleropages formosus]
MRRVFSLVLLLLFSLTETAAQNLKIKADQVAGDRIQLTCENGEWVERQDDSESKHQLLLAYKDENSKEYICKDKDEKNVKILVKFRSPCVFSAKHVTTVLPWRAAQWQGSCLRTSWPQSSSEWLSTSSHRSPEAGATATAKHRTDRLSFLTSRTTPTCL